MALVLGSIRFSEGNFMLPKLHKDQLNEFCLKMDSLQHCIDDKHVPSHCKGIEFNKFFMFLPICQPPQRQGTVLKYWKQFKLLSGNKWTYEFKIYIFNLGQIMKRLWNYANLNKKAQNIQTILCIYCRINEFTDILIYFYPLIEILFSLHFISAWKHECLKTGKVFFRFSWRKSLFSID